MCHVLNINLQQWWHVLDLDFIQLLGDHSKVQFSPKFLLKTAAVYKMCNVLNFVVIVWKIVISWVMTVRDGVFYNVSEENYSLFSG